MKAIKDVIVTIENDNINTHSHIAYTKIKNSERAESVPRGVLEHSDS
jgi:hypothetical protein